MEVYRIRLIGIIKCLTMIVLATFFIGCEGPEEPSGESLMIRIKIPEDNSIVFANSNVEVLPEIICRRGEIRSVELYINGTIGMVDTAAPYKFDIYYLKEGQYRLKLRAQSSLNQSVISQEILLNVISSGGAFIKVLREPDFPVEMDTVNFEVSGASPFAALKTAELVADDTISLGIDSLTPYKFSWDKIQPGEHSVIARVVDDSGKVFFSRNYPFKVKNNEPPQVRIEQPEEGNEYIPGYNMNYGLNLFDQNKIVKIECFIDDSIIYSGIPQDQYNFEGTWKNIMSGSHTFYARAADILGLWGYSDTITVFVAQGFRIDGRIVSMSASEREDLIFAVNAHNNELYYINPISKKITETIELPFTNPVAMKYDDNLKNIYIVYNNEQMLSVWNTAQSRFTNYTYGNGGQTYDLDISPNDNLVLISAKNGLTLMNMSDGTTLAKAIEIEGNLIAYSSGINSLFTVKTNTSPTTITKYLLQNLSVSKVEDYRDKGGNAKDIFLSPVHDVLVCPTGAGNGPPVYSLYAFDPLDLKHIFGYWDIGTYPISAVYDYNGARLIGANGLNKNIYIMDAKSFRQLKNVSFKFLSDNRAMCVNASGSVLTVFTSDMYDKVPAVYFFNL